MKKQVLGDKPKSNGREMPYEVHLPGFVAEEDIGLGDAIKRVTSSFGIKPCSGCERRASMLNRFFVFSGRHAK